MRKLCKKMEEHATIIGVWASIATIIGVILTIIIGFQTQKLDSYMNLINNNVEIVEVKDQLIEKLENQINSIIIKGEGNITIQDSIVNQMEMNPNDFSVDELLRQAEGEINSQSYKNAYIIYTLDVLKDNPIAQCNLGYLYSNGYGVKKDLKEAEKLYLKSFEAGCNQAMINRFVLYKNNIQRDNDYESFVYVMLNEAILNENNPMHEKAVEKYGNKIFDGEKEDLRHTQCDFKLDVGVKKVSDRPLDTWRIRWYWISNTTQSVENIYGRYQLWGYDERECSFDYLFSEETAKI